eukprot:CAMPEP_0119475936 /NCGR_PEP_ID=MMETSP1344-20130328/6651_1 /TAXON_ID=236787 /ORGANISM="Florenciella parvula, Strain CCMP2471" /LENGTH=255 /DNA_ID=CAMNT_0007509599 /DNA_START=161 /DNA_END=925 /DNA_ORIENTATION=-
MAPSVSHFPSTAPTLLPTLVPTMSPAPTATPVPTMGPTFIEIIHGHGKVRWAPRPFTVSLQPPPRPGHPTSPTSLLDYERSGMLLRQVRARDARAAVGGRFNAPLRAWAGLAFVGPSRHATPCHGRANVTAPSSSWRNQTHNRPSSCPDPFMIAAATFGGMLLMLAALLIYRGCLKQRDYNYTRVHHGLDDEEQEFKKTLESQTDEIDDLFNFGNDQELEFDASELEQIEMLETYRSNLVAASGGGGVPGGDDVD